jgi:hypothetical protein
VIEAGTDVNPFPVTAKSTTPAWLTVIGIVKVPVEAVPATNTPVSVAFAQFPKATVPWATRKFTCVPLFGYLVSGFVIPEFAGPNAFGLESTLSTRPSPSVSVVDKVRPGLAST